MTENTNKSASLAPLIPLQEDTHVAGTAPAAQTIIGRRLLYGCGTFFNFQTVAPLSTLTLSFSSANTVQFDLSATVSIFMCHSPRFSKAVTWGALSNSCLNTFWCCCFVCFACCLVSSPFLFCLLSGFIPTSFCGRCRTVTHHSALGWQTLPPLKVWHLALIIGINSTVAFRAHVSNGRAVQAQDGSWISIATTSPGAVSVSTNSPYDAHWKKVATVYTELLPLLYVLSNHSLCSSGAQAISTMILQCQLTAPHVPPSKPRPHQPQLLPHPLGHQLLLHRTACAAVASATLARQQLWAALM